MKDVLFVILDQFADWEAAQIATAMNDSNAGTPKHAVKAVSLDTNPVKSIGGFTVAPYHGID